MADSWVQAVQAFPSYPPVEFHGITCDIIIVRVILDTPVLRAWRVPRASGARGFKKISLRLSTGSRVRVLKTAKSPCSGGGAGNYAHQPEEGSREQVPTSAHAIGAQGRGRLLLKGKRLAQPVHQCRRSRKDRSPSARGVAGSPPRSAERFHREGAPHSGRSNKARS
jgi:hypothetical protein